MFLTRKVISFSKKAESAFLQILIKNFIPKFLYKYYDLIIIDDIFPHPLSPFRLEEFNYYLNHFSNLKIYSSAKSFKLLGELRPFKIILKEYLKENKSYKNKILAYNRLRPLKARMIYLVFLNNVFYYLNVIEEYKVPFIFTLYPGGGLLINEPDTDIKLRKIFQSKYFQHVIVTQKNVYNYIIEKEFCSRDKISYIFGIVLPTKLFETPNKYKKQFYPTNKLHFDICFVAHKYTEHGLDKGYDLFIETAKLLNLSYKEIHFHIVGPWTRDDYNIEYLEKNIHYYGSQQTSFFPEFYSQMDIILSPNRANILKPGAFDGFPTGSVTEASIRGVAMFVTDPLCLNEVYKENEEIIIINEKPIDISEKIEIYYNNIEPPLYAFIERETKKFRNI